MFQLRINEVRRTSPFALRIPSRPVRYAIVATHTLRSALAELQERLEAIDERPLDQAETKAKTKRGKTTRQPRAKAKK